jgi:hypothetical protein
MRLNTPVQAHAIAGAKKVKFTDVEGCDEGKREKNGKGGGGANLYIEKYAIANRRIRRFDRVQSHISRRQEQTSNHQSNQTTTRANGALPNWERWSQQPNAAEPKATIASSRA